MKKIIAFILISVLCLTLCVSCESMSSSKGGKGNKDDVAIGESDVKDLVEEFTGDIIAEFPDLAIKHVHPKSEIDKSHISGIIFAIAKQHGIDSYHREYYFENWDIKVKGGIFSKLQQKTTCVVECTVMINDLDFDLSCTVLDSPEGFGILTYSLTHTYTSR